MSNLSTVKFPENTIWGTYVLTMHKGKLVWINKDANEVINPKNHPINIDWGIGEVKLEILDE